jgi:hypothetical protein
MAKAGFKKKRSTFYKHIGFGLRKKLVKYYIWSAALYGAEN